MPHILIMDSGLGGLSVTVEIAKILPDATFSYVADNGFFPYGTKSEEVLIKRICAVAVAALRETPADLAVIACNTASTVALAHLREILPIPVVGVVPAIKPAAARSKTGVIGLLGTNRTITAPYTEGLIADFAPNLSVIKIGSTALVEMAEAYLAGIVPDDAVIQRELAPFIEVPVQPDIIVLACTHFPLLRGQILQALPQNIAVIDSGHAIALRVFNMLENARRQHDKTMTNSVYFTAKNTIAPTLMSAFLRYGFVQISVLRTI